ncbi:mechanosensitive ion channel family protein [Marinobacter sp. 1Y8]
MLVLLVGLMGLATASYAQSDDFDPAQADVSPVTIDGEVLFRLAGTNSFPSAERAGQVAKRIAGVARNSTIRPEDVRLVKGDNRVKVMAGKHQLLVIFPIDASIEGAPIDEVSEVFSARIASGITDFRSHRTSRFLLRAALYAGAAVLITTILIWAIVVLFRRLFAFLETRYKRRVQDLKIESFEVMRAENIWGAVTGLLKFIRTAAVLVLAYLCIEFVLYQFPWTRSTATILLDMVVDPLTSIVVAFFDYLPELIFLIILIAVARYLIKLMHLFFRSVERGRVQLGEFDPEWAQPTFKLLRFFVILLTAVLAYPYIPGSGSAAFQGLSLLLGIMVSLGASSAVSSIVAGYAMTYRRAFRIGDLISVGEYTGVVEETRLLVTHLRTVRNEEIVLPNALILNSPVNNLSRSSSGDGLVLHTTVGIGYETPWRQVEAMLKEAASRTRNIRNKPAPFVLEKELGDFAVVYELNVYVDKPAHRFHRYAELHRNILDVFNEYGVAIMTPSYIADPEEPKLVPKDGWYAAPAMPPADNSSAGEKSTNGDETGEAKTQDNTASKPDLPKDR